MLQVPLRQAVRILRQHPDGPQHEVDRAGLNQQQARDKAIGQPHFARCRQGAVRGRNQPPGKAGQQYAAEYESLSKIQHGRSPRQC